VHSKRLADQTLDVDPDQAYLVGLCHAIGSLESLMGRGAKARQAPDLPRVGLELAREWSLPSSVVDYFSDLEMYGGRSSWVGIVQAAHRAADGTPSEWASGMRFIRRCSGPCSKGGSVSQGFMALV
jgi:HD-like signal output (HDOD) protein